MNIKVNMLDNGFRKMWHYFVFSTNGTRTVGYPFEKKIELQSIPCSRYKINSNWIPDRNIKSKTKKQREKLGDLGLGKDFLGSVPKAQFESTKKNKLKNWTLSKQKTSALSKTLLREKTSQRLGKNIFKSHI